VVAPAILHRHRQQLAQRLQMQDNEAVLENKNGVFTLANV
jgi:hypothetical protein